MKDLLENYLTLIRYNIGHEKGRHDIRRNDTQHDDTLHN